MVPFDNKKKELRKRSSSWDTKAIFSWPSGPDTIKSWNVLAIKEGELIQYDPLNEEIEVELIGDDVIREETPAMGYYAIVGMKTDSGRYVLVEKEDVGPCGEVFTGVQT